MLFTLIYQIINVMKEKGFAPVVIILGIAAVVVTGFLIGRINNPGSLPSPTPSASVSATISPTPTNTVVPLSKASAMPLVDCVGPDGKKASLTQKACDDFKKAWIIPTPKPTATPAQTVAVPPTYQLEARLVCARADEGYATGDHLDLIYRVIVNGDAILATLTLTDNKTKDVFDFAKDGPPGNSSIKDWSGQLDWGVQDRNYKQMIFTGDGREYTLKLYKLTTASEAVTQDLQPVAQTTFSKTCAF